MPSKPGESELLARINSVHETEVMPPPSTKQTLTEEEKAILERLDREGAATPRTGLSSQ